MFRYVFRYGGYGDARVGMVVYVWLWWILVRRLRYVEQSSIKLRLGGQGSVCCFKISLDMASSGGWGEFCSDEVS